ncbi:hypothetical protein [Psychrobacter sp. ASPA161_6]|uniref:hypothetical protein n=1 Tax=Psychrobacter sp. ASPA161_6 TaxID=3160962 RepID=UPI003F7DE79A
MIDYKLVFDSESQANDVIEEVTGELHPSQYVRYDIGNIKRYEYDENNLEAEPTVIVVSDKYHVDLRLRAASDSLDEYVIVADNPVHSFS